MAGERPGARLMDRLGERRVIDRLVAAVRAGQGRALVLHGEAGVGKTALLHYLTERAAGCRVVRTAGVQSEMELAFAGLHQMCAPLLDLLDHVPDPQREALLTAFGLSEGSSPDRFMIGLAVLSLLSAAAEDEPLIGLVDDAQSLDQASGQTLGFVARRLAADPVGLVFATRAPGEELAGLPRLAVDGLGERDARALLDSALAWPVDSLVRDRFIAETRGNPLALLELSRGLTSAELAGGFGLPAATLSGRIEESFRRQLEGLPAESRRLLQLAAADPSDDQALVWRAASQLGIGPDAAVPPADADLAHFGVRVRFRHPLVRSAAYQLAPARERRLAHAVLADVTDPARDPDRRAWHRAQAALGPDEDVAGELERCASRARARGGLSAAAAFLERAATLTLDPAQRAARALAAAQAKAQAGAFDAARELLAVAENGPLSELQRAQVDLLRAQLAFFAKRGSDAPALLLNVATRLERVDVGLARQAYLDSMSAAMFAGRLASPGGSLAEVARVAGSAPRPPHDVRAPDLLLDGFAAHFNAGYAAGLTTLRAAVDSFGVGMSADEELRRLWLGWVSALHTWDDERSDALSDRFVRLTREAGSFSELPLALTSRAYMLLLTGELTAAASVTWEVQAATEATGGSLAPYGAMVLAALRGDEAEASALIETVTRDTTSRGEGVAVAVAGYADAMLNNGLGRDELAMTAAQRATSYNGDLGVSNWAVVELIEAAARSGMGDAAVSALDRLREMTGASGTDWALGIEARCRALLSEGEEAERLYRESIERLSRTRLRPDLARGHLLFGEWLRHQRGRHEAREQLRIAYGMLEAMGMKAFAERARRELVAVGGSVPKTSASAVDHGEGLTAQEAQVARLARDGLSNPEIGARLFISARTVQYHLGKVFAKLDISSRGELHRVLTTETGGA